MAASANKLLLMRYFLIVTIIFSCLIALAQKKRTSSRPFTPAMKSIDSIVNNINRDSTIRWFTTKPPAGKERETKYIQAACKNGELVVLQHIESNNIIFGNSQTFYFHHNKPILYCQRYSNASRMGSCGQISVNFYHYLNDSTAFAGIAKSVTSFYSCHGYKLARPVYTQLEADIKKLKLQLAANASVLVNKNKMPFLPVPFLVDGEIQERYGF